MESVIETYKQQLISGTTVSADYNSILLSIQNASDILQTDKNIVLDECIKIIVITDKKNLIV